MVLLVTGHMVGTIQLSNADMSAGQDGQAEHMIARDFTQNAHEHVLFDSASLQVTAPAYQAALRDLVTRIQATGRVINIRDHRAGHAAARHDDAARTAQLVPAPVARMAAADLPQHAAAPADRADAEAAAAGGQAVTTDGRPGSYPADGTREGDGRG